VSAFLLRAEAERNLSPHTRQAYRRDLAQFLDFCDRLGTRTLTGVDRRAVRRWQAQLSTRGFAATSISRKVSAVRSFFRDAARRDLVAGDPSIGLPTRKKPSRLPRALGATKTLLQRGLELDFDQFLELEAHAQSLLWHTADHREGVAAFRERRTPRFVGR